VDVVNSTAAPFMNAPPAEQGTAGVVAQGLGGVLGVIGAPQQILDTAFAAMTAPIAALFPALPAVTLLGMHVGVPHAHSHPPSLIPPAPPVPLPSIGMLVGSGSVTVLLGGMPAARAGDIGISVTCGSLAPPFEVFTGSSNVFIGGARAARILDITKHCNPTSMGPFAIAMGAAGIAAGAAGAIAGNSIGAAAQAAADAAVLAVKLLCGKDPGLPPGMGTLVGPPVPNVLIGGFPCPPVGEMAFGAILKGLGKLKNAVKKRVSKRSNGKCANGSHPIYLVTGENFDTFVDFVSGGLFEWRRHYTTARARIDSPLGHAFRHFYQRSLRVRLHRAVFTDWDGVSVEFPRFEYGVSTTSADDYVLRRVSRNHYIVSNLDAPQMEFTGNEFDDDLRLTKIFSTDRELAFAYDTLGRLAAALEWHRPTDERRRYDFTYDENGHILQMLEVPAQANAWSNPQPLLRAAYVYAKTSDLVQAQDALGGVWAYEYDAFHRWLKQTDPRGYSYTFRYDAFGRCIEASGKDGLWWCNVEYFPEKNFTRYTEGEKATWEYHYDADGVITKIVDPYGNKAVRELDGSGKVVREVDSGGRSIRWLYDENGAHYARIDRFGNVFPPENMLAKLPNPFRRKLPQTALAWSYAGALEPAPKAIYGADSDILWGIAPELLTQAQGLFRLRQPEHARVPVPMLRVEHDAMGRKTREVDVLDGKSRRLSGP
jgi:YD repeat-containing protein